MISKTYKLVSLLLVTVFLLAACAPKTVPTVDTNDIANKVMTAVAATISAQQSQTAAAQPLATATPVVIPTETPMLPTATPFVIASSTLKPSSGGGGGGPVTYSYACDIVRQRPYDNTTFHPGDSFDVKWTIVNTGTATWVAGLDLVYYSGPKMTGASFVQLPQMKPGDTYSIVFDAHAPMEKGHHVMTWKLQGGFCYPYVAINVE